MIFQSVLPYFQITCVVTSTIAAIIRISTTKSITIGLLLLSISTSESNFKYRADAAREYGGPIIAIAIVFDGAERCLRPL